MEGHLLGLMQALVAEHTDLVVLDLRGKVVLGGLYLGLYHRLLLLGHFRCGHSTERAVP